MSKHLIPAGDGPGLLSLLARLRTKAEQVAGAPVGIVFTFRYKIVPLEGKPGSLTPMSSLPILTTNEVELTAKCSPSLSATFNRGLISTQHVATALRGNFNLDQFKAQIGTEGNQLRNDLTGDMTGTPAACPVCPLRSRCTTRQCWTMDEPRCLPDEGTRQCPGRVQPYRARL
jgi:hypothetical protein